MAMKKYNRHSFTARCLRNLGAPVMKINLSEEQIDDAVERAITYYQRNHYNGNERIYMPIRVTDEIKQNGFVQFDEDVIAVEQLLLPSNTSLSSSLFTPEFVIAADAAWSTFQGGGGLYNYYSLMMYRELLEQLFQNKIPIEWQYNTGRAYIIVNPGRLNTPYICFVVRLAIDPERDTRMYTDPWLIEYTTTCIKETWGQTLKKYESIQLPGGATLTGAQIYQEAVERRKELEERVIEDFQEPCDFFMG